MTLLCALGMSGCMKHDINEIQEAAIKDNAKKVFGDIDASQDWNSISSHAVTVTANANLRDVVKVQILTESPYLNPHATVLNEVEVTKGQTVALRYDAPNVYTRLIAACVDSKGNYYTKGFDVGQQTVSFARRQAAPTRAATALSGMPDVSQLKLEYKNSVPSFNALRTQYANTAAATGDADMQATASQYHLTLWQDRGWENERLWKATDNNKTGTEWSVVNGTVLRTATAITDEEKAGLQDIWDAFLGRKEVNRKKQDNMPLIRNSDVVRLFNNHLTSDGTQPVSIIPVSMASSEIGSCHLYYYYYNPADIPAGTSEEAYVKQLPKFKAIQCWYTRSEANSQGYGTQDFFKVHEYLLPYYGDGPFTETQQSIATTDGKLYRLRNGQPYQDEYYYLVYTGEKSEVKLATRYADDDPDVANQLWQIFTTPDGYQLLYNVGGQQFLTWDGQYATTYSSDVAKAKSNLYQMDNQNHIWRYNNSNLCLGTDLGVAGKIDSRRVSTDKGAADGDRSRWFTESYIGHQDIATLPEVDLGDLPFAKTAVSTIIPKGYRIGFMLRKVKSGENNINAANNGCTYGFGALNKEINNLPGHFASSITDYTMQDDDPRIAMFTANGKTYLGFEDGSDCQYSDMIIELGGYTAQANTDNGTTPDDSTDPSGEEPGSGIVPFFDMEEVPNAAYTMCFEDRLHSADYDLNDVVLRCVRLSATKLQISLVAAGGQDNLVIHGIGGTHSRGEVLNGQEVHELFDMADATGINRCINTRLGVPTLSYIPETVTVDPSVTIPQFLSAIWVENLTTGQTIHVPNAGEPPYAIIVPLDFNYPLEGQPVTEAYAGFLKWATQVNVSRDWYLYEQTSKIFPSLFR